MSPIVVALLGAIGGALLAAILVVTFINRPAPKSAHLDGKTLAADLAQVLDAFRSAVVIIGPHDEVIAASPYAETAGLIRGNRILADRVLAAVRDCRKTENPTAVTATLARGLGEESLELDVRVAPLRDDYVVFVADDRADDLRIEATRRDFMTNVTHELKTPVGAIQLLSEAIESASDNPAAIQGFTTRLRDETQRLSDLITQIISWSKLQSVDPLAEGIEIDLARIATEVVSDWQPQASKAELRLTAVAVDGAWVTGDAEQLKIALSNLVANALTYTDPGGRVTVTVTAAGEEVKVLVSDTGIGIAAADHPRVFERFYRVDFARSRAKGGTGLGLAIVKLIVAAHGGTVSLWSQPGRGSTFTISLPAARTM